MSKNGWFITFEGTDGVGKSTQIRLLKNWLVKHKRKVVLTREPGGGPVSEKIRNILLDPRTKIEDLTELFLYQTARIEHVEKVVRPALRRGKIVLCDRFTDATLAYQGFARGLSLKTIQILNAIATAGVIPNLTIWLDHSPKTALKKARSIKKKGDRLENEGLKFQQLVRRGYQWVERKNPRRVVRIQVQSEISDTQNLIREAVKRKLFS